MSTEKATEVPLLEGINREVAALRSANQQQEPKLPRERPILFSSEMVRAILDGRKTQTRRVVLRRVKDEGEWVTVRPDRGYTAETIMREYRNPFGAPSDRLWVKETFANLIFERDWESGHVDDWHESGSVDLGTRVYNADPHGFDDCGATVGERGFAWTPAIFMPRRASRIDLEVTSVRVERVQEITWQDALAEGIEPVPCTHPHREAMGCTDCMNSGILENPVPEYAGLWDFLNKKRGYGWDVNPWVWVIGFRPAVDRELAVD